MTVQEAIDGCPLKIQIELDEDEADEVIKALSAAFKNGLYVRESSFCAYKSGLPLWKRLYNKTFCRTPYRDPLNYKEVTCRTFYGNKILVSALNKLYKSHPKWAWAYKNHKD